MTTLPDTALDGDWTLPTDTEGPRGTYGCACMSRDSAECHRLRYGIVAGDVSHGAEKCECACHYWSDDDDD